MQMEFNVINNADDRHEIKSRKLFRSIQRILIFYKNSTKHGISRIEQSIRAMINNYQFPFLLLYSLEKIDFILFYFMIIPFGISFALITKHFTI